MAWTQEMISYLHQNAAMRSASQIAKQLGVTRNAVVGRARRDGCILSKTATLKIALGRETNEAKPATLRHVTYEAKPKPHRKRIRLVNQLTEDSKCTIEGLTFNSCRWPLWGDEATTVDTRFYCGCYTRFGPYCAAHTLKAERPVVRTRPKRPHYRP